MKFYRIGSSCQYRVSRPGEPASACKDATVTSDAMTLPDGHRVNVAVLIAPAGLHDENEPAEVTVQELGLLVPPWGFELGEILAAPTQGPARGLPWAA